MTETLNVQQNRLLSDLSTFGIGGPARHFVEVHNADEMRLALQYALSHKLPYFILGKGSNCLFDSKGYNGLVILNKIDFIEMSSPEAWHVGAGYSFSLLGSQTARKGLSGLEFASGIPGTVGGAVYMNAGANGGETCMPLVSVDFMFPNGTLKVLKKEELKFSYRFSSFQKELLGAIIGATFSLKPCQEARQKQMDIIHYRKNTQPLQEQSAGCIFRNPHAAHAGALIEKSGLKGVQMGGAKVSEIHANFIVNAGSASSTDVEALIAFIKTEVQRKTGHQLESEVKVIPYEQS